ncbi:Type II restriction/modification system, DNA methylase subunit YeeA [Algoriphagus faecimaris]|uniref:site-specific DNA-methyltransferase (adenine-specific) n=1 Tax=Algoriphagus faecimaris TaxID=686796 RepID=A0A1G6UCA9_9BACT|nr:DNA methyltransferase [Algoriphagus faecimaris]SDD38227.1 Type II restriction/modification system, DNA methylase subunit YeeA [Algoriphagus faecimaris]
MALSWNEIKDRALRFTKEWEGETRERAEKDSFWNDFFHVFGISRRRLATFEEPVKKLNNQQGFIDLFWKGTLLVEHKSKGKNLDAAFEQATDYFHGIKEHELPKYVLVSDFDNFKLYDLDEGREYEFHLSEFHKNIKLFGFIAGYQKRSFKEEDAVNIAAAELMGKLHDQLEESGYTGHALEMYLVRLLFCLFADDTGIFEKDTFKELIEVKSGEDGSNLSGLLAQFFQVLNTPRENRMSSLDEHLATFPYVNGKLFEEFLPIPAFNSKMREILLQCSALNWGKISPAIFGSMFQSVMDPIERRNLGAHYTSEKNILKLIKPLFLDELREEFEKLKGNKNKLREFHQRLGKLKFLDPACGCGNFLIITYRELRLLELDVLKEIYGAQQAIGIQEIMTIDVDQFYGIEYDEFPARIAEVALWLMDHQMNLRISEEFGQYYARLPLRKSAKIVHGNALRINWEEVVPKEELSYILGNPPFYGYSYQSKEQRADLADVFSGVQGSGVLDYVTGWYLLAAKYIQNTSIEVGFVSTNSISQGEQVGILWKEMFLENMVKINFAHRTFNWKNEAKGNAAVHVVIIGFGLFERKEKKLFSYEDINGEPLEVKVRNINPYLVNGKDLFVSKRSKPLCNVPEMTKGSSPTDGGNLIIEDEELDAFLNVEPLAKPFIRQYLGSREFLNNIKRWCLWLKEIKPSELKLMPVIQERLSLVRKMRLESSKKSTQKWAEFPALFIEERQPLTDYVIIPRVSSERRKYIPLGYIDKDIVVSDSAITLPNVDFFIFGVLTSGMHMTWVNYTCGRLKSDYRYSNTVVYNNFPWPKNPSEKNKKLVEEKAQKVLDTRAKYPESSLADLYDPLLMPPDLVKAHQELDRAVDLCYRPQAFTSEMARIEYLFELYEEYLAPLMGKGKKR